MQPGITMRLLRATKLFGCSATPPQLTHSLFHSSAICSFQVMEPGIMGRLREYVMANGHPQAAVEYLTDSYVGEWQHTCTFFWVSGSTPVRCG